MDLKVLNNNLYTFYDIDVFTRLTIDEFIKHIKISRVIYKVMPVWIGRGLVTPK